MVNQLPLQKWSEAVTVQLQALGGARLLWILKLLLLGLSVVVIAYALAGLASTTLGQLGDKQGGSAPGISGQGEAVSVLTLDTIRSWGWYSAPSDKTTSRPAVAAGGKVQKTRLKLVLEGIVHNSNPKASVVIITAGKKTEHYTVDDKLPGGSRVYLREVKPHSVILENNGRLEELLLFDSKLAERHKVKQSANNKAVPLKDSETPSGTIDKRQDESASKILRNYQQDLQSNPQALMEKVSVTMVSSEGGPTGLRINSRGDASGFAQLGLAEGDIVTHVNGIDVSDTASVMQLYQQLGDLTELELNVWRENGEQQIIYSLR